MPVRSTQQQQQQQQQSTCRRPSHMIHKTRDASSGTTLLKQHSVSMHLPQQKHGGRWRAATANNTTKLLKRRGSEAAMYAYTHQVSPRTNNNRSMVAWSSGEYYTPILGRRKKSKSAPPTSKLDDSSSSGYFTTSSDSTRSLHAGGSSWYNFCGQVEMITGGGCIDAGSKQAFAMKASELHNKVIQDMKQKSLRRRAKTLIIHAKLEKAKEYVKNQEEIESETDSEEELEREQAEKRRAVALRHWNIIRREVNERIRQRKENNTAKKSWNILQHQLRAQTHAEAVRLELYIKYGVVKAKHPELKPIAKPRLSDSAKRLINGFEHLNIKTLSHNTQNQL